MSKRFLGLLLPFLLVYGIDDLDLDGLDLPQVEQEAKSEEKKPDEVEKVVVPLSEAKEAEAAEESKGAEEGAEAAQKEASQSSQNPAAQESKGAEKQAAQPQGEKPEANQAGEQKSQGQGANEAAKAGAQSGDASAPNVASDMPTDLPADLPADMPTDAKDNNAESKGKNATQGADTKAKSEVALPEELQMQNHEIPAPAPQPKTEDKLPEGFGPEDLPPEALDGVSGGASPATSNSAAGSNAPNPAAPNAISPAGGAMGATGATPAPALPNQDPNAPTAPQGATPPASGQPKVQLEENAKQSDKKQDGKEVTFTQEDFFELDEDDFMLEKRDGGYVLKVLSLDLEAFVNGKSYNEKNQVQTFGVNENYTQITSHDGKIQEYKFFQKAGKKNTILNRVKVPLKKLDFDSYKLVMKDTPSFFDATNCKVGIKKELRATLNQNKEVIIDLDIRRELRNTTKFKLFLDCPR